MAAVLVETQALTKRYGKLTAVDQLDLRVEEGEIYGFLGPNGSGKTTTILMLLGLTEPTSGRARVVGYNPLREPLKVKRVVGYLPENVGFYGDLTAVENMRYTADLNGIPRREADQRITGLLAQVGLAEAVNRPVGQFSRGMRQRLGIADVLLKQPHVVFLDDPTIGLDPEGIQELLALVVRMSRDHGITVFLSSHLLHQVQRICHRVGIMFRGRMVAQGTMAELAGQERPEGTVRLEVQAEPVSPDLTQALERVPGVQGVKAGDGLITLDCAEKSESEVARAVLDSGARLMQLRQVGFSLEEIYLRYFHEAEQAAEARLGT